MSDKSAIKSVESYEIPKQVAEKAYLTPEKYEEWYKESITNPEKFWEERANEMLHWFKPWDKTLEWDYQKAEIKWFQGGKINVSYNCLDRHLESRGDKTAILWEGDEPGESKKYTYKELHNEVCCFANVLKKNGIEKGDRVAIYMPMVPELAIAMLACIRIGAVHSIIFGGFSAEAIKDRVEDSSCKMIITANEGVRGGRTIPLKQIVDKGIENVSCVKKVIVLKRTKSDYKFKEGRDISWEEEMSTVDNNCPAEHLDAEDPLFILYTSGSTGKPKGVLHTQAGYLLYVSMTHKYVFDYHEDDIYFCAADIGWVTGHSYIIYGPLSNGATTLMFESVPTYPDLGRYWDVIERYKVNIFYTAPTAIRAIAKEGDRFVRRYDLSSLRILGSVGEPINYDAWKWYHDIVGRKECTVVDTWWQTETGGIMITPLPGVTKVKPGSATKPFFGIQPCLVDSDGNEIEGNAVKGRLCIKYPWPGQMRTVYGDHDRFIDTYFKMFPGKYFTGDGCTRDQDGYYWITGRVDDVLNVSGHRLGTAEIESAIVSSGVVAEAAVVGMAHDIKGVGIYAYCILMDGEESSVNTENKIKRGVREVIGPIATPDVIQIVGGLPKTRSGKIMRRILRKIAEGEEKEFGDISTLADPSVVEKILEGAKALRS